MNTETIADKICNAEFLELSNSYTVHDIVNALKIIGLTQFEYGQSQDQIWANMSHNGVEYVVCSPYVATAELFLEGHVSTVTLVVRQSCPFHDDLQWSGNVVVPSVAHAIANVLNTPVVHCKTRWNGTNLQQDWDTNYLPTDDWDPGSASTITNARGSTASKDCENVAVVTTVASCRPQYDGPLDFVFVVHPRTNDEKLRPFPETRRFQPFSNNIPEELQSDCLVLSRIEVELEGRQLRGELLAIPFTPYELIDHLSEARQAIHRVIDYAASRHAPIVGLGALLPSISRQGRLLKNYGERTGITTGHGFTAIVISQFVRNIEEATGFVGPVAVVGAAGSTGRAAVRCLIHDNPKRPLICLDLLQQVTRVPQPIGWDPALHKITADRSDIKQAKIVVCVTNAPGNIFYAEDFGPNTVILDDAQPENVSQSVLLERPDLTVIKCLASIPGLHCPFDFGLFAPGKEFAGISFTCLAEVVVLAAEKHKGSFVLGDPTDSQFDFLREHAPQYSIGASPFLSFPELGAVTLSQRYP